MIFDLIFILLLQPIFNSIFFLLPPILDEFFKERLNKLNFKIFLYTFLSDFIFVKPFGFFLLLVSFSLLILSFLEKIISSRLFYQKFVFLLIFNLLFLSFLSFFNFQKIILTFFGSIFLLNFLWQIIYIGIKNLFFK